MSFDYINKYYGTAWAKGQRVRAYGKAGTITGADGKYLKIKIDGAKHANNYHPTDGLERIEE